MKTGLYLGPIDEIFLEAALLEEGERDGVVLAQFDNLDLAECWTHSWTPLPRGDFQIYEDSEDDDNI